MVNTRMIRSCIKALSLQYFTFGTQAFEERRKKTNTIKLEATSDWTCGEEISFRL